MKKESRQQKKVAPEKKSRAAEKKSREEKKVAPVKKSRAREKKSRQGLESVRHKHKRIHSQYDAVRARVWH